jgi:membrane-bound metal-dependent hydrolase YbcI (DUF457 family)
MGPGILIKAILQGSFSLMVFGWTQIIMDIQPLIVILTGEGRLHGFTHTYVGATLIALFSAVTGKYLSEWALRLLWSNKFGRVHIGWVVATVSAFIGSYSHVVLDSLMHSDMTPLFPFSPVNQLLGVISAEAVYRLCVYTGLFGAVVYFAVQWMLSRRPSIFRRER